jgi:4-hydroxy-2-oxoheptanedioate aldolase
MSAPAHPDLAVWLSTPHTAMVEIARDLGFGRIVLDVEHGIFDLDPTDRLVAYARALGFGVYVKVLGPESIPIQQALDIGADGVIIPHVLDVEHAAEVCAAAKYPPLGKRSFAGGRTVRYDAPPDGWFETENRRQLCFPMVETAQALADIDAILGLATVDGVFVGPSDLALSRGRDRYRFDAADQADLKIIAKAAKAAGKPWIMPAWTAGERKLSAELGAAWRVVADETGSIYAGLETVLAAMKGDQA